MSSQAVTLDLPLPIYDRFKSRAESSHRSIEAELLDAVTVASETAHDLPDDLRTAVDGLVVLDDDALWDAARIELDPEVRAELETLYFKQQEEGLSPAERERLDQHLRSCDRVMLVRGHAAKLLKERGHDVSRLLES